jgi:hypothetical protein
MSVEICMWSLDPRFIHGFNSERGGENYVVGLTDLF